MHFRGIKEIIQYLANYKALYKGKGLLLFSREVIES